MGKIKYAVIGSGWRAEFYIRMAKLVPDRFELTSVLIRDSQKGRTFAEKHDVKVVQTLKEIQTGVPNFVVLAIKRGTVSRYLYKLYEMEIPVLCETPPGETLDELNSVWDAYKKYNARMQVAEQYFMQPLYAAWEKVIRDGKLGEIQNLNLSALHGYHGVSIIRRYLGVGFENAVIYGKRYWFDVANTCGRNTMVPDGKVYSCSRDRLTLEFDNGKVAFFDFSDPAQYHSFIRTRQLTVQGTRGEIDDLRIRYLTKENVAVNQELSRIDFGIYNNQEWTHHGIMLGEEILYSNPFEGARINDDEIAVASCLQGMSEYLQTGNEFYSLREALQDMYICLVMDEALREPNKEKNLTTQKWVR